MAEKKQGLDLLSDEELVAIVKIAIKEGEYLGLEVAIVLQELDRRSDILRKNNGESNTIKIHAQK